MNGNPQDKKDASVAFMDAFCLSMVRYFPAMSSDGRDIAVAVSGGADSLALCFALSRYFEGAPDITIHALTVDHRLRAESTAEALHVAEVLAQLPNVHHAILNWEHEQKPKMRIQEQARQARYDLMLSYMKQRDIHSLFLGHHRDDQAETFLFRLSKGSGVDGLACMSVIQDMEDGVALCRPCLEMDKADMVAFCTMERIPYIHDPSNDSDVYARVRLRQSMDILSREGLSSKRLSVAAMRFSRARDALSFISKKSYKNSILRIESDRIEFNLNVLLSDPEEVVLRVLLQALSVLKPQSGYGVRLERVESLCADLVSSTSFRKRTLGGVVFYCDNARNILVMALEHPAI